MRSLKNGPHQWVNREQSEFTAGMNVEQQYLE